MYRGAVEVIRKESQYMLTFYPEADLEYMDV